MRRVVGFGLAGFVALVVAGVSVSLASTQESAPLLPDVIEEVPSHLQVQNTQQREWLRFTTVHVNIGAGNLQIRGGGQIAPCDIDGIHYDQCTVATQELLDAAGRVATTSPAASPSSTPSTTTGTSPRSRSSRCGARSTARRSPPG